MKIDQAKFDNLILELGTMIESGSIIVGALGLSEDSAKYVHDLSHIYFCSKTSLYE